MSFSNKLKELRLQNGLSQEQVSRKLDIATRTYTYYESGQKYPSVELLARLAKFFNVSISFLLNEPIAGGELSEAEKETVIESFIEAYCIAKKKNKQT